MTFLDNPLCPFPYLPCHLLKSYPVFKTPPKCAFSRKHGKSLRTSTWVGCELSHLCTPTAFRILRVSISAFFQFSTVPSTHTHLPFTESIAVNHWAFFFFLKQRLPSTTVCTYPFKALEFFLKVGIVCGNGGLFWLNSKGRRGEDWYLQILWDWDVLEQGK